LVYFSAHWCPPCRGFTPELVKSVKRMKANGKKVEAVFISSDSDESSYKKYFAEMEGFLSLPYVDRERKAKLSAKYKVQGIPTLVVLDNQAQVITKEGRKAVMNDPEGKKFPWIPPTFAKAIGDKFLGKGASTVSAVELKGKTVGIYFSAHWCGPCQSFTPELVKTYHALNSVDKKNFEVIFVSSDKTKNEFEEYFSSMPWLAIPYEDGNRRELLNTIFSVEGIPCLVLVNFDTGTTIQREGRMSVALDPTGKEFPWAPKPVNELSRLNAKNLNETAGLIVFLPDKVSDEEEKKVIGALEPTAKDVMKANPDDLAFYVAKKDAIVSRVRSLFGKQDKVSSSLLVGVIDIPRGCSFVADIKKVSDITSDSIRSFYKQYQAGNLKGVPLPQDEED